MNKVVAVSGGVDSVVLLDMLVGKHGASTIIVAHFDHGIRPSSSADAVFVQELAHRYGCIYEGAREELGVSASEERARDSRYRFLHSVALMYDAQLVTAHHLDDLVETVVLQNIRGTGWRGLTPFGQDIERPLLDMTKEDILDYARAHRLAWREDETNQTLLYARNRIRPAVGALPIDTKRQIHALYTQQWAIRADIDQEVAKLLETRTSERYFFIMTPPSEREELLRALTAGRLTRPQLTRLAHAICVAKPRSAYQAGAGIEVHFTTRTFSVKLIK